MKGGWMNEHAKTKRNERQKRQPKDETVPLLYQRCSKDAGKYKDSQRVSEGDAYEMARDEARHGKAFEGLLKRYFG